MYVDYSQQNYVFCLLVLVHNVKLWLSLIHNVKFDPSLYVNEETFAYHSRRNCISIYFWKRVAWTMTDFVLIVLYGYLYLTLQFESIILVKSIHDVCWI